MFTKSVPDSRSNTEGGSKPSPIPGQAIYGEGPSLRHILTAFIVIAIIWFAFLGHRDLIDPDEGRYAEISRTMLQSGDWITPRLNGFKYFEKPAFQYWASASIFKLFGQSNFTARLWPALIGMVGAFWVFYLGSRLFGKKEGFLAFLILSSGTLYFSLSHMLTLDLALSVFMMLGMGGVLLAQQQRDSNPQGVRRWMLMGWASFAIAVLIKGLVGIVLPAAAVVLYSLWQRDWSLWKHLHIFKGIALFTSIVAPWFIAVCLKNEEFFQFFFIHEHFERYTTTQHHRLGPVYYFIPILLLGVFPWIAATLRALVTTRHTTKTGEELRGSFDSIRFLWTYCAFIFVFFSLGGSKLPSYILPMMPALALLTGRALYTTKTNLADAVILGAFSIALGVASFWIPELSGHANYALYQPWVIAASVFFMASCLSLCLLRSNLYTAMTFTSLLAMVGFQMLLWGYQSISSMRSAGPMAQSILQLADAKDIPIYQVNSFSHSLPFYLNREISIVQNKGELAMGIKLDPDLWVESYDIFSQKWDSCDKCIAIFDLDDKLFSRFKGSFSNYTTLYEGPRKIVLLKRKNEPLANRI